MFKSRSDSAFPAESVRTYTEKRTDIWDNLVRITHIMLKKRFYLTSENSCDILTISIRIEDS